MRPRAPAAIPALVLVAIVAWQAPALAQECAEGRVRVSGRCCWPEQTWSDVRGRCEGPPRCPAGRAEHGDDCVPAPAEGAAIPEQPAEGLAFTEPPLEPGPIGTERWATSTSGWPSIEGSEHAPAARAVIGRGEDEGLITFALAVIDVGWVLGWMGLMFDELAQACWGSCNSWFWGFGPLFGGITGSLVNHSGSWRHTLIAFPFGVTSVCLQGLGLIALAIALANETTEPAFQRLDLTQSVTASIVPGAAGSDAGLTLELSF